VRRPFPGTLSHREPGNAPRLAGKRACINNALKNGDVAASITAGANALESLPAHYLEVVLLRDFEELTIAEIAERLDEQPGALKSRLHRARELVREYLLGAKPK
jgi:DNA-directed RNA polymerase specialized sigma24 family protein